MELFAHIPPAVLQACGALGFALYAVNYTVLTLRWVSARSIVFFALNLVAATLVLIALSVNFELPSSLLHMFVIIMSLIGIGMRLGRSTLIA